MTFTSDGGGCSSEKSAGRPIIRKWVVQILDVEVSLGKIPKIAPDGCSIGLSVHANGLAEKYSEAL